MGQRDEENPASEDEAEAEKEKLRPNPPDEMEMTKIPVKTKDANYPEVIAGHDDPFIKSHHLKYLLFGFNGFLLLLGIAMLAVSVWVQADPEFWEYNTTLNVGNFKAVCAMLIVASIVILLVGVLGSMGAASENRGMLILYMCIFGLVFLMEIAALVLMFSAPYSSTISTQVRQKILKEIEESPKDDTSRYFIDFMQEKLQCCGATSVDDYDAEAPNSCLNLRTGVVHDEGCVKKFLLYVRSKSGIVAGVAIPVLFIQLFALLASGCLIKNLLTESGYAMSDAKWT